MTQNPENIVKLFKIYMNRLQFSTDDVLDGPWLLDVKALRNLDSIISKHWKILEDRRQSLLDLIVDDEYRKYEKQLDLFSPTYLQEQLSIFRRSHPVYSVSYLQIRVQYKKSTYYCESFDSALKARELDDIVAEGLVIEFCSGDIKGRIDLSKTSGMWINMSPEEIPEVQDFFREITGWAKHSRVSYWQRLWGKLADLGYWPYLGIAFVLGAIVSYMNLLNTNTIIQDSQEAAIKLLDQGITDTTMPEAVKLLLEIQVLGKRPFEIPGWIILAFFVNILFGIIISIRPKVVLGIGKGSDHLRYWKIWQTVIGITLPSLIFYNFILPYIVEAIKKIVNMP